MSQAYCGEPRFDESQALYYMEYARAAFCDGPAITDWNCGEMCKAAPTVKDSIKFIEPSNDMYAVQGYVAEVPAKDGQTGKQWVAAFRGSVEWQNWIEDFAYIPEAWPRSSTNKVPLNASWCKDCMVHSGFATAFDHVQSKMVDAIHAFECSNMVVAGHSLGGAMATLAAIYIRGELGIHVEHVYTYGKPRVGNYAFVDAFIGLAKKSGVEPAMWRLVHFHDPVPRVPAPKGSFPSIVWKYEYAHETDEVYYQDRESSMYQVCPPTAEEIVNRFENPVCSWATPLAMCIDNDHVEYLNKTFKHTDLGTRCIKPPQNTLIVV